MEQIPRDTPFWEYQKRYVKEAMELCFQDHHILELMRQTLNTFKAVADMGRALPYPLDAAQTKALWAQEEETINGFTRCRDRLIAAIVERHASLAHVFGPHLWEWIGLSVFHAVGVAPPSEWGERIERFLPDNPLLRLSDGRTIAPPGFYAMKDATRWERQMRDYERSLREPRKPGRKRKVTTKEPSGYRIDGNEARLAAELHDDGKDKWDIAITLGLILGPLPSDRNERKRILRLVARRIERGHLLLRPPPKSLFPQKK